MRTLRILGIDPGLASTGAVVLETGVKLKLICSKMLRTKPNTPTPARLSIIAEGVREVILKYRPKVMAIETAFIRRDAPKAGLSLGKVLGVILLTAFENKLDIAEITPREAKETLTGYGNAQKEQIQRAVQVKLGLKAVLSPSHVADAAAMALTAASIMATLGKK